MAAPAIPITQAPTCAGCLFGAVSSRVLSYSYHAVETITVSVIPHVTVFSNGTNSTSTESIALTKTEFVQAGSNATDTASLTTFANIDDITWTLGSATLTYPTTYIQYLGFQGAAQPSVDCLEEATATEITLPESTERASFIYPYTKNASLPVGLLGYLDTIPTIAEQLGGQSVESCAPLSSSTGAETPSYTSSTTSTSRDFEGPRTDTTSTRTLPKFTVLGNNSTYATASTGGTATTTRAFSYGPDSSSSIVFYGSPVVEHSTAFVISRLTGPTIITSQPAAGPQTMINGAVQDPSKVQDSPSTPDQTSNPDPPSSPDQTSNSDGQSDPNQPPIADQQSSANPPAQQTAEETEPNNDGDAGLDYGALVDPIQQAATEAGSSAQSNGGVDELADAVQAAAAAVQIGDTDPGSDRGELAAAGSPAGSGAAGSHGADGSGAGVGLPTFDAGGTLVSPDSQGEYQYGDQTLHPGEAITVNNGGGATPVAIQVDDGSTRLMVGDKTYEPTLPAARTMAPAVVEIDGQTFSIRGGDGSVVLADASSTIAVSAGAVTSVGGAAVSVAPDGAAVMVDGKQIAVPAAAPPSQALLTANGLTFSTAQHGSSLVVFDGSSSFTLAQGSATVIHGETISAKEAGGAVVVNGKTASFPTTTAASAVITAADGDVLTVVDAEGSVTVVDGTTGLVLGDGSQHAFQGHTISALASGNGVVVDGSLSRAFDASASPTSGMNGAGDESTTTPSAVSRPAADTPSASATADSGAGVVWMASSSVVIVAGVLSVLLMM